MFRRKKTAAQFFKTGQVPYDPLTGRRETLRAEGDAPYCAMVQVAATDTHDNYVLCRGYDPRVKRFFNYDSADPTNVPGIPVAKPYGNRNKGAYIVGQVFPAFLPRSKLGQNAGVVEDDHFQGHPIDLDDTVGLLTDDDGRYIDWMLIDNHQDHIRIGKLDGNLAQGGTAVMSVWSVDVDGNWADTGEDLATVRDRFLEVGADDIASGKWVKAERYGAAWIVTAAECP
jgi:hypothetical protein